MTDHNDIILNMLSDTKNFTNFVSVRTGNITKSILYRSCSPLKSEYVEEIKHFAVEAGIDCIINLVDNVSSIENLAKDVSWYYELIKKGNVFCLPMTFVIPGDISNEMKLKAGLRFMLSHKGPYLIHCSMGIDRTDFVIAVLEALMGANINQIRRNYLLNLPLETESKRIEYYQKIS